MASYTKILAQLTFITITIDSHWVSHLRTKQIMSKWWNIGYSWTEVAGEVKSTLQTSKQIKARRTKITTLMPFVCCLFDILVIFRSLISSLHAPHYLEWQLFIQSLTVFLYVSVSCRLSVSLFDLVVSISLFLSVLPWVSLITVCQCLSF